MKIVIILYGLLRMPEWQDMIGRGRSFVHYNIVDRLNRKKANWAYDVYEDEYGSLWIATYLGGIFIVNKRELLAHDDRVLFRAEWNLSDSLISTKVSEIAYQIETDKYGFIWVNTQKRFSPDRLQSP